MLRLVLCNCGPEESGELARGLVEANLVACVNVFEGVRSFYEWEGEIQDDREHTLLIKTTDERYDEVKSWIREHHSYDVPEIVAVDAADVFEEYLDWVEEQAAVEA